MAFVNFVVYINLSYAQRSAADLLSWCVDRLKKDVKCIIFVERRTAARVLANLVNHLECLSEFLQARSICGANAGIDTTRGQQQSTVAEFNQGQVDRVCFTALMCERNNQIFALLLIVCFCHVYAFIIFCVWFVPYVQLNLVFDFLRSICW